MVFQQIYHEAISDNILSPSDWQLLEMTVEFLQPFWQATLAQEKHWASLDQALYNMDILLKHFEDAKVSILLRLVTIAKA